MSPRRSWTLSLKSRGTLFCFKSHVQPRIILKNNHHFLSLSSVKKPVRHSALSVWLSSRSGSSTPEVSSIIIKITLIISGLRSALYAQKEASVKRWRWIHSTEPSVWLHYHIYITAGFQLRTWMFGPARYRSVLSSGVSWGDQPPEKVVPVDTAHPSRPDINEPGGLRSVCTMNIVTYVNLCVTQHTSHCLSYLTPSTHTSINSFHVVWQSGPIWPVVEFWRAATGATTQSPDVRCLLRRLGLIWEHV